MSTPTTCGACIHCGRDEYGRGYCKQTQGYPVVSARAVAPDWCPLGDSTPVVFVPLPSARQRIDRFTRELTSLCLQHGVRVEGTVLDDPLPDGTRYTVGLLREGGSLELRRAR